MGQFKKSREVEPARETADTGCMSEPPLSRGRRTICSVLYAGMICVGIYAFYLWLGAEAPDTRSERKGFWLMASAGIAVGALGLYLMWTDILAPLFRKRT